jgi:hypothetical protein
VLQKIVRKDGVIYEREIKQPNDYNSNLNIRVNNAKADEFKEVTKMQGLSYSDVLRNMMDEYVANHKNNEKN